MTKPAEPVADIESEIEIHAPILVVWETMTSTETVPEWLGCLEYAGRVGSRFYMQPDEASRRAGNIDGATCCEIETMNAPETFVFSWFFPDTPKTYVRFDLVSVSDTLTRVRLKHFGWDQFPAEIIRHVRDSLAGGWQSAVLPQLKAVSEMRVT